MTSSYKTSRLFYHPLQDGDKSIIIRQATPEDNDQLQELQGKCPQVKKLIVSIVNTPDFFARAKAYESYRVFVACEENRIIGSHACGIREAKNENDRISP
ncbi:MAG: hypothetical protein COZ69_03395 [Deltaproteobacteria bacterium CG_4_8_14_3_um_filter_45_9]|nr:MAG: hypothetical protein COZ69_03395 [Deltaproteobacteria bacterium CG_4_8_14_3_um_filter_45_9]